MNIGFFSASLEDENFQEKLFGSLADRSPFVKMEEQLSKMKDEIFNSVVEKKSDEELLEEAIENEDYETAAKLRDKINNRK